MPPPLQLVQPATPPAAGDSSPESKLFRVLQRVMGAYNQPDLPTPMARKRAQDEAHAALSLYFVEKLAARSTAADQPTKSGIESASQ